MQPDQDQEQPEIQVDEDWKKIVAEEKQRLKDQEAQGKAREGPKGRAGRDFPEPSIQIFLAGLYTQTLVALGALENPLTGKRQKEPAEAAYLIDTVDMLKKKTQGNLTAEESTYVESVLYDLRMRYVSAVGQQKDEQPDADKAAEK